MDRLATERFGIPSIVLMENAARGLCVHALDLLGASTGRVIIVCGTGNNGGDGYALARHLCNHGREVELVSLGAPAMRSDAAVNSAICRCMGLRPLALPPIPDARGAGLIVDAIFGTGLTRPAARDAAAAIEWINHVDVPVLSVDVPSGLDCDTGESLGIAVRATRTVTFAGTKPGFQVASAKPFVGEIGVVDIGVPIDLVRELGEPLAIESSS